MKVLVAYAGKTGTTKKCVDYIKMVSDYEVTLYDTKDAKAGNVDINSYDYIIVGGSIRVGVVDVSLKKFVKTYNFSGKMMGLFVVCGVPENSEKYLRTSFPMIVPSAEACFGGEFALSKVKGLEKLIIKRAIKDSEKKKKPLPMVNYEEIKAFLLRLFSSETPAIITQDYLPAVDVDEEKTPVAASAPIRGDEIGYIAPSAPIEETASVSVEKTAPVTQEETASAPAAGNDENNVMQEEEIPPIN